METFLKFQKQIPNGTKNTLLRINPFKSILGLSTQQVQLRSRQKPYVILICIWLFIWPDNIYYVNFYYHYPFATGL